MPSQAEIRQALTGMLMLARLDTGGMRLLDLTVEGFWKSFTGPLLAAPAFALLVADRYARTGLPAGLAAVVPLEAVGYCLGLVAFPIAAIFLTRLLGLTDRYVPLIVAGNWSTVPQAALLLAAITVANLAPGLAALLVPLAGLAALAYSWFVVRTALATTASVAAGLVVVDVLMGVGIDRVMDMLLPAAQP